MDIWQPTIDRCNSDVIIVTVDYFNEVFYDSMKDVGPTLINCMYKVVCTGT